MIDINICQKAILKIVNVQKQQYQNLIYFTTNNLAISLPEFHELYFQMGQIMSLLTLFLNSLSFNFGRPIQVSMDQKVIDFLRFFPDTIGFLVGSKGQFVSYG